MSFLQSQKQILRDSIDDYFKDHNLYQNLTHFFLQNSQKELSIQSLLSSISLKYQGDNLQNIKLLIESKELWNILFQNQLSFKIILSNQWKDFQNQSKKQFLKSNFKLIIQQIKSQNTPSQQFNKFFDQLNTNQRQKIQILNNLAKNQRISLRKSYQNNQKRKKLRQIFQKFKLDLSSLIQEIINGGDQESALDEIEMSRKQSKELQALLKSPQVSELRFSKNQKQEVKEINLKMVDYVVKFMGKTYKKSFNEMIEIKNIKQLLKKQFGLQNDLSLQCKGQKNQNIILGDNSFLIQCSSKYFEVNYFINIYITVQFKNQDIHIIVKSNQTISQIQQKQQDIIGINHLRQQWYLDNQLITNQNQTTFQSLEIKAKDIRFKVIQEQNLEYYGFQIIKTIDKDQFKQFYIEDDNQTLADIQRSDFPNKNWSESFRKICLGYIFSGLKKHSKIQSSIDHIKSIVQNIAKGYNLWKPKNVHQNSHFNETYIIYNIIKSSAPQLRVDILNCLMTHYPIPLIINNFPVDLFQDHYWISNKSFTIFSFGFRNHGLSQIQGKSTLLNILFETDFPDKMTLHRQCKGGVSIQYNIFRNDQYFVNLIDASNDINQEMLMSFIHASNMLLIHTSDQSDKNINIWIKNNNINIPIIVFHRDISNAFHKLDLSKSKRQYSSSHNKAYFMEKIDQKSLKFHDVKFNMIANDVQSFLRAVFMQQKQQNMWNFSKLMAKSQNCKKFNSILSKISVNNQQMTKITKYFYQYKSSNINEKAKNDISQKAILEGISEPMKLLINFYRNNLNINSKITNKLRKFLNDLKNQTLRYFNQLQQLVKTISHENFLTNKQYILNALNKIQLIVNQNNQQLHEQIHIFYRNQSKYNQFKDIDDYWNHFFNTIKEISTKISNKPFSIQILWRQFVYMSKFNSNYEINIQEQNFNFRDALVQIGKQQINQSTNFQIIDGDLLEMFQQYQKKIFQSQQGKAVKIVGVLGPQSSGKSTLLNFTFGCDFASSAGRCTKGIYGTYFEISNKQIPNCQAVLVLDTQGLFSNFKGDDGFSNRKGFDSKLVLFCLSVCDLIIFNIKGDITSQVEQILLNAYDSQILEYQNLPSLYFVLNCNGGPINPTQSKQIQRTCNQINKLFKEKEKIALVSNAMGLSMAFNQIPRKTNANYIQKFMYPKKVGTHVFYKETKKLGEYIFKALSNRGRQKDQKTLNQALENMKLTWATISRYQIITVQASRKAKQFQKAIEIKLQNLVKQNQKTINSTKQQANTYQNRSILQNYLEQLTKKLNQNKIKELNNFQQQFKNYLSKDQAIRMFSQKAKQDIKNSFQVCINQVKQLINARIIVLVMEDSKRNGLLQIRCEIHKIKLSQLNGKKQTQDEKKFQFQSLWTQRIQKMKQSLNKQQMALDHLKNMRNIYNNIWKMNSSKTIFNVQQFSQQRIERKTLSERKIFLQQKMIKLCKDQIFSPNYTQKPIMNIEKGNGDLNFRYLDMSKYFDKKKQKVYICFNNKNFGDFINHKKMQEELAQQVAYDNALVDGLHQDFINIMGIDLKKDRIHEWVKYHASYFLFRRINFSREPHKIDISKDANSIPIFQNSRNSVSENRISIPVQENLKYFNYKNGDTTGLLKIKQYQEKLICCKDYKFIYKTINKAVARTTLDGNNKILNQILQHTLKQASNSFLQQIFQDKKCKFLNQLNAKLKNDFEKINLFNQEQNDQQIITIYDKEIYFTGRLKSKNWLINYSSEEQIKLLLRSLDNRCFKTDLMQKKYIKRQNILSKDFHCIGFIEQQKIIIRQEAKHKKILQKYIGKQYDQFLNQIKKSNFTNFLKEQLNETISISWTEIEKFIQNLNIDDYNINNIINNINRKVDMIIAEINKDLKQVSQKLSYMFIVNLHSYAFYLIQAKLFQYYWKTKENVICQFQNTKQNQLQEFLGCISGEPEKQNEAAASQFAKQYKEFLNKKFVQKDKNYFNQCICKLRNQFSRQKMQQRIEEQILNKDQDQMLRFLQSPIQFYIQFQKQKKKVLKSKVDSYQNFQFLENINEMKLLINQMQKVIPNPGITGNIFELSIKDEKQNHALLQLFCQILLNGNKRIFNSQQLLGNLKFREDIIINFQQNCQRPQNKQFFQVLKQKKIQITQIHFFCQQLLKQLSNLKVKTIQEKQIIEFYKELKLDICEHQCPICKKLCDIDMGDHPHHKIHQCKSGHYLRAFGGMMIKKDEFYQPSLLSCNDLKPDSQFQFNGKLYKWSEFKLQYKEQWKFQTSQQKKEDSFNINLWKKIGPKICQTYHKSQNIQYIQLTKQLIQQQISMIDYHKYQINYIFALDESGSMSGQKWKKAIAAIKQSIQLISNNNLNKNLLLSFLKFNKNATVVTQASNPQDFNINSVSFAGGGTSFSNFFKSVNDFIKKHKDKNNALIFITDGQDSYPEKEITQLKNIMKQQKQNKFNVTFHSIYIFEQSRLSKFFGKLSSNSRDTLKKITKELDGKQDFVKDALQISIRFKEVHFKK